MIIWKLYTYIYIFFYYNQFLFDFYLPDYFHMQHTTIHCSSKLWHLSPNIAFYHNCPQGISVPAHKLGISLVCATLSFAPRKYKVRYLTNGVYGISLHISIMLPCITPRVVESALAQTSVSYNLISAVDPNALQLQYYIYTQCNNINVSFVVLKVSLFELCRHTYRVLGRSLEQMECLCVRQCEAEWDTWDRTTESCMDMVRNMAFSVS